MRYAVGLDIGGTNIGGGVVGEDGSLIISRSVKTQAEKGPEHVIRTMADLTLDMMRAGGKKIGTVGIGSPGPLNQVKGIICDTPNLPGWESIPIVDMMEEQTNIVCVLENDANAACMGEKLFGAGKKYDTFVHLTLGTGIGGGLFLDGALFRGADGAGAELGHMVIDADGYRCGCGRKGCFEVCCSDSGIRTQVRQDIGHYPDTELRSLDNAEINFKVINELSGKGDEFAGLIYERVVRYFGIGVSNLVNIFNPQAVILSGGMVKAGETFIRRIEQHVKEQAFDTMTEHLSVCVSGLGEHTGVLGAAACALMN